MLLCYDVAMNEEYEDIFGLVFREEMDKISPLFKPGKKQIIGALVVIGVAFIALLVTVPVFYNSAEYGAVRNVSGMDIQVVTYDNRVLVVQIILAVIMALVAAWLIISKAMEKHAYRKATSFAAVAYESIRQRKELRHQEWKRNNNIY